jgi:hypothetical protein
MSVCVCVFVCVCLCVRVRVRVRVCVKMLCVVCLKELAVGALYYIVWIE